MVWYVVLFIALSREFVAEIMALDHTSAKGIRRGKDLLGYIIGLYY